jgi:hypothetical protein
MRHRVFGRTGEQTSEIGMGCMRFEAPEKIDEMARAVYRAFERGVNYFDTAPYYCNDKSEDILGRAVKEMKKAGRKFYVATKTGVKNGREVRPQLERSLKRLNVDCIDFYHVWCLIHASQLPERKANGVLDEFRKAKEEGLIRHVCVSTHLGHDAVGPMLDLGDGLFEGMLIGLNMLNFNMRLPGAKAAAQRGMGVVTMNTLGGGLLMDHSDHYKHLLRKGDPSLLDTALRFNLSLPEVTTALIGFRNEGDVDSALDAYERVKILSPRRLEEFKKSVIAASLDFCTQCNYCRDCPVEIPIVRFMEAYNHRIVTDGKKPEAPIFQLRYHWGVPEIEAALSACTECRHCEDVCTQHLPILERFEALRKDERKVKAAAEKKKQEKEKEKQEKKEKEKQEKKVKEKRKRKKQEA